MVRALVELWQITDNYHPTMSLRVKQVFKSGVKLFVGATIASFSLAITMAVMGPTSAASRTPTTHPTADLRQVFLAAEEWARAGNFRQLSPELRRLQQYPLFPYLEATLLRANFDLDHAPVVHAFLKEHGGTPVAGQVRRNWLSFLASEGHTEQLLKDYQGSQPLWTHCHYLAARLKHQSDLDNLWLAVTETYLHGRSLPRACDSVLAAWSEAGNRTPKVVWQRLQLALEAGETGLASYLTRYLPPTDQVLAEQLQQLYLRPASVGELQVEPQYLPQLTQGIQQAIRRLRWQNIEQAAVAWLNLSTRPDYLFSVEVRQDMNEAIGIAYGVRQQPEQAQLWLASLELNQLSDTGRHWLLASYLHQHDFAAVEQFTARMLEREPGGAQWLYWYGRARAERGDQAGARRWLHQVARQRNYYGFLAAARLGLEPEYHHEPLRIRHQPLSRVANHPAARRAYELWQLDRPTQARREWNALLSDLDTADYAYAAGVAYHWGWYAQSIHTFSRTERLNDVERRFPLAFADQLQEQATEYNLNPAWLFAIARRESAFQRDAVSPVGARGLMQVLPETAAHINQAGEALLEVGPDYDLFDPEDNVRLSAQYLATLLLRFDNNSLLVTAAYNAGFGRVQQWLEQMDEPRSADIWIELVPFRETRDYVKAVLSYQQIYAMQLDQHDSVFRHLTEQQVQPMPVPALVTGGVGSDE